MSRITTLSGKALEAFNERYRALPRPLQAEAARVMLTTFWADFPEVSERDRMTIKLEISREIAQQKATGE